MIGRVRWRMEAPPKSLKGVLTLWLNVLTVLNRSGLLLTYGVAITTIAEAALSVGSLYALKLLIDAIGRGLTDPSAAHTVYLTLVLAGSLLVASVGAKSIADYLRTYQGMIVGELIDRDIHAQAISVDLSFYESPRYLDSLQKAREAGIQRPSQVIGNIITLARSIIVLGAILFMLAAIEWRLLPILFATVGAALLVRVSYTRRTFAWRMMRARTERRAAYLDWMLTSNIHAKELRLNRLGRHFSDLYASLRQTLRIEQLSMERRRLMAEFAVALFGTMAFMAVAAFLVASALAGRISIGQVVLFVLLLRRAEAAGAEMVSGLSRMVDDHLYLGRLFDFLDTREKAAATTPIPLPSPLREGLVLDGVSFTYPGAVTPAVDGLNLRLPPRSIVALVGENGSGKTTLIKLLTRLYDPTRGRVTLDGRDVREFDPLDYRSLFSVIFQDYAMYPETARENIRLGDVSRANGAAQAERAAQEAGAEAFISRLPLGYDTPLTKAFDEGHDLSLGQWQRLALARAFFPESKFVIMDEPTSAVDPASEFELFDNFRERLGQRAALIISHRLSTIRQADYIYVLDNGIIAESGTHGELIEKNGAYAKIFEQQSSYYKH